MKKPLRVALSQINTIPGDIPGNVKLIREAYQRALVERADILVTPELALVGYCPRDLLFRRRFADAADEALGRLMAETRETVLLVGTVMAQKGPGRPFKNCAVALRDGQVLARFEKVLLPVYDVFDEARYFEAGGASTPFEHRGWRIGVTICEDLWIGPQGVDAPGYGRDPAKDQVDAGAEILLNLSASPFQTGKPARRAGVVAETARRLKRPVALCNLWGGNDEILFDGTSIAVDASGGVIQRAKSFEDDFLTVSLDTLSRASAEIEPSDSADLQALRRALTTGIRDYAHKCGFKNAVLGLSGGIDSALTASLAVEALSKDAVQGIAMPSRFSSPESVEDALDLARRLGIPCSVAPIEDSYRALLGAAQGVVGEAPFGLMEENLQARIRGVILMAVSNRTGALLLTTGNKSEVAVGYCTLYGDMCGGLAAISDVYKTDVYRLAAVDVERGLIPERSLTKPPSAELRPNQRDQDSLPPYEVLDEILRLHVDRGLGSRDIVRERSDFAFDVVDRVLALVARSEYKRKQAAPGLRVSEKAFGYGRRVPLVASNLLFLRDVSERGPNSPSVNPP